MDEAPEASDLVSVEEFRNKVLDMTDAVLLAERCFRDLRMGAAAGIGLQTPAPLHHSVCFAKVEGTWRLKVTFPGGEVLAEEAIVDTKIALLNALPDLYSALVGARAAKLRCVEQATERALAYLETIQQKGLA